MPYATERLDDHMQEDAAARIARRIDRDLRLRTRRRRAALIAAVTSLGVLLLVVALSVAMARGRDTRSDDGTRRRASAATVPVTDSPESTTTAGEEPTPSVSAARPDEAPAPKPSVQKAPPRPSVTPTKRKAAPPTQSDILVQKCSGSGCHSTTEVAGGGLDRDSAEGAIQAMTDGGYVKLTPTEFEAVIAALTRK